MSNVRILGINGGSVGGNTHALLDRALIATRRSGSRTKTIHLPFPKAKWELLDYDGVIFATPVHWFNVSAPMKEFIDSLTLPLESEEDFANPPYPLDGIVCAFIASCSEDGGQQAINAMMAPLNHMGMIVMPFGSVFHNINMQNHGQRGWQETEIEGIGERMVEFIDCLDYVGGATP